MRNRSKRWTRFLVAVLLAGLAGPAQGQGEADYVIRTESRLWIDGTSTVDDFTCAAASVRGFGRVEGPARPGGRVQAEMTVPVQGFDCGRRRMNRDLYDALQAEAHPVIQFDLEQAGLLEPADAGTYALQAAGQLTIAGVRRAVTVQATGRQLPDGRVRIAGRLPLRMSDFGIEPPTALMGLVRAHDPITVRFDLVVAPTAVATAQASR